MRVLDPVSLVTDDQVRARAHQRTLDIFTQGGHHQRSDQLDAWIRMRILEKYFQIRADPDFK
jgi:hypothetical protein